MAQNLSGKIALITGASSGIGRAAARALAAEGVKLALAARSVEKLDELVDKIGKDNAIAVPTDLTKPDDVDHMISETIAHFGRIDVLFANAGMYIPGDAAEGDPDKWDEMITVNVNSVFRAIRAVLPHMIANHSGDIVVTSSISGHQAIPWEPVYSATKHAVLAFVHGVRRQVAPHNIRIGALAPGMVLNELWGFHDQKAIEEKVAERAGLRSEDVAEALVFMLTRPANVTIRDLVMLPQSQDL